MFTYEFFQNYWWLLISLLGAILVFLLFVQGGQSMIPCIKDQTQRALLINSIGRKWELTFTSLVVFGGAFFASFPLFYSTSFGGAYWLWMIILFSFIVQAISFKYRMKSGNVYGYKTYDTLLFINGIIGPVLLGVAVSMMFFGAEFSVNKVNILNTSVSTTISQWSPTHGIEAIFNAKNLVLGVTVLFLARVQASLYFINNIDNETFYKKQKKELFINAIVFVVFFLGFVALLLTATGVEYNGTEYQQVEYKYFNNLIEMPYFLAMLLIGVVMVLFAIIKTLFKANYKKGIWFSGIGTILVVLTLLCIAGYNNTAYFPSLLDINSSLTIQNSSSSEFTLKTMSIVSLIVPIVVGYIWYAWYSLDKTKITEKELTDPVNEDKY